MKPPLQSNFFPPKFPFPKYKRKIWREKNYFAKKRVPRKKTVKNLNFRAKLLRFRAIKSKSPSHVQQIDTLIANPII
jgi:hypothetical protein